jgi:protein arginine kinase
MAWYHIPGNRQDAVVSTRVRLSRNLADHPFPSRLDAPRAREVLSKVGAILEQNGFAPVDFADISRTAAEFLVEKGYASASFVRESIPHALYLNEPCNLSVMVCEEDHVSIRCIHPGLSTEDAFAGACKMESLLDGELAFAFDKRLGYLTANPAHLGTAMGASVLLCLPMLAAGRRAEALSLRLGQAGLLLQGLGGGGGAVGGIRRTLAGIGGLEPPAFARSISRFAVGGVLGPAEHVPSRMVIGMGQGPPCIDLGFPGACA